MNENDPLLDEILENEPELRTKVNSISSWGTRKLISIDLLEQTID